MAKAGYFGGNPETVFNASGDVVIDTFRYEMFTRDYETALFELNNQDIKK